MPRRSNAWYKAYVGVGDRKSQQAQMELQWRLPLPDVAVCCQVAGRQGAHEHEPQIKTRLNVRTEDVNDQMIQQLRERADAVHYSFTTGLCEETM